MGLSPEEAEFERKQQTKEKMVGKEQELQGDREEERGD
jgi:hypothetical protein